jgi:hypothetical protein
MQELLHPETAAGVRRIRPGPPGAGPVESRLPLVGVGLVALSILSGCGDQGPAGSASLEATETLPAVHFGLALPSLPKYVERWAAGGAADEALAAWRGSWDLPRGEGERVRRELNLAFAGVLATNADRSELEAEVRRLDRAVEEVDALLGSRLPAHLLPTLGGAGEHRDAAGRALAADEPERAVLHLLEGFDRLRSASPAGLARELLAEGERRFEQARTGDSRLRSNPEDPTLQRVERLMIGARDALENGSPVVALRRAWYAVRLLDEGISPEPEGLR